MDKAIIMVGNISDGYKIIGPFASFEDAADYDDTHNGGGNWVSILTTPNKGSK